jgi:hypothetical protein
LKGWHFACYRQQRMRTYLLASAVLAFSLCANAASTDPHFPYDLNYRYTQVDLDTNLVVLEFSWQHAIIPVGFNFNDSAPESMTFFTANYNPIPEFFNNASCVTAGSMRDYLGTCQYGYLNPFGIAFVGSNKQFDSEFAAGRIVQASFNLKDLYQNGTYATQTVYLDYGINQHYHELGILTVDTALPEPSSLTTAAAGGLVLGYLVWRKRKNQKV